MNEEKRHPIQVVARRTGLTPDVLRAWERRYGVVLPARSPSRRRLYSDADIGHLRLLRQATTGGRSIGQVASLSAAELAELVQEDRAAPAGPGAVPAPQEAAPSLVEECLRAIEPLDGTGLEAALRRAVVLLEPTVLVEGVVVPLMERIGELWCNRRLHPGQEHFASSAIRKTLGEVTAAMQPGGEAPALVVATPSGQVHEIGAMLVAATAAAQGWRVTYLGVDLPVSHVARAARDSQARAVALSLVYPPDDDEVDVALRRLRQGLPAALPILVGGRAAASYRPTLDAIGAAFLPDLGALRATLASLYDHPRTDAATAPREESS